MNKMATVAAVIIVSVFFCWATEGYEDIAKLVKAGVGDEVIIAYINTAKTRYALTSDEIKQLKTLGVSDKVVGAATRQSGDTVIVNIPNDAEGFTAVKLVKTADGYVGPQGEFYAGHPTVRQLKALYGK